MKMVWYRVVEELPPIEQPVIAIDRWGIQHIVVRHHKDLLDWYTTTDGNKLGFNDIVFWIYG